MVNDWLRSEGPLRKSPESRPVRPPPTDAARGVGRAFRMPGSLSLLGRASLLRRFGLCEASLQDLVALVAQMRA